MLSSETEAADEDVPAVESAAEEADDFTEEVLDEEEEVSAAFDSTIYVSLAGVDVLPLASCTMTEKTCVPASISTGPVYSVPFVFATASKA